MEDTAENRLKNTVFVVEATDFEVLSLWRNHAKESPENNDYERVTWQQMNPGWIVQVGKLDKRPCCISTQWVKIDGQLVMFYEQCSQVCDSVQTQKWLKKHFKAKWDGTRPATTNAMNFGHCLQGVKQANEKTR